MRGERSYERLIRYIDVLRQYEKSDPTLIEKLSNEFHNTAIDVETFLNNHKEHESLAKAIVQMEGPCLSG